MSWRDDALAHAVEETPKESCGLLIIERGLERYWRCRNLSQNPHELFIIDPADWAKAEDAGEVIAVVHSHPNTPPSPSQADLTACEASGLRWEIVNPQFETWGSCEPSDYKSPLIGRPWIWNVTDCWTLVRDWYGTQGIDLPDWKRPATPEEFDEAPMFDELWSEAGFRELAEDEPLEVGDALLFNFKGKLNHVGVLVEPQMVLHHVRGRLSSRDLYGQLLLKSTGRRLRHASQD
jgi:proteasome lid subunit RPN8/RPN11